MFQKSVSGSPAVLPARYLPTLTLEYCNATMKPFIAMSATKNGSRKRIRLSGNREDQVFRAFCSFRNAVIDDLEISVELEEIEFDTFIQTYSCAMNCALGNIGLYISGVAAIAWSRFLRLLVQGTCIPETVTFRFKQVTHLGGSNTLEMIEPVLRAIVFEPPAKIAKIVRFRYCIGSRNFLSDFIKGFLELQDTSKLPSIIAVAGEEIFQHAGSVNASNSVVHSRTATCEGPVWVYEPFVNEKTKHKLAIYVFQRIPRGIQGRYDYPVFDSPPPTDGCTNLLLSDDYCFSDGPLKWWRIGS